MKNSLLVLLLLPAFCSGQIVIKSESSLSTYALHNQEGPPVDVNALHAPTAGQILIATDSTHATWQGLPTPTASTLGGVKSLAAVSHQWINAISTSGVPSASQPGFADISGTAAIGQIPIGTSSSNVTVGNDSRVVNSALAYTEQVITPSSGAVTMDMSNGWQATCTVTQNTTLTLANLKQGGVYSILFSQTTGGAAFTITFPTGSLQANGGSNVVALSGTNQRDLVYFRATGSTPAVIIEDMAPNFTP